MSIRNSYKHNLFLYLLNEPLCICRYIRMAIFYLHSIEVTGFYCSLGWVCIAVWITVLSYHSFIPLNSLSKHNNPWTWAGISTGIAQVTERRAINPEVRGSHPAYGSNFSLEILIIIIIIIIFLCPD